MFLKNVDQQSLDYCCLIYDANKLDTLASAPGMFNRHLQKIALTQTWYLHNICFVHSGLTLFLTSNGAIAIAPHISRTWWFTCLSSTSTQSLLQFLFKSVNSTSAAWSGAPRTPLCLSPSRANWHCPQRPGCTRSSCCSASFLKTVFQSSLFTWYTAQRWLLQQRRREEVKGSLQVINSSTGALRAAGDAHTQTSCGAVFPPCVLLLSLVSWYPKITTKRKPKSKLSDRAGVEAPPTHCARSGTRTAVAPRTAPVWLSAQSSSCPPAQVPACRNRTLVKPSALKTSPNTPLSELILTWWWIWPPPKHTIKVKDRIHVSCLNDQEVSHYIQDLHMTDISRRLPETVKSDLNDH